MMRKVAIGLAVLALVAGANASAQSAERLVAPALPGFVVGYSAANAVNSIREEIPIGQSLQRWTRMVTTQWFADLATKVTPAQYAQNVIAPLPRACPRASVSPIENITVSGRQAVRFQVDCPKNSGGTSETFMFLAIAGQRDMHVKQVAFSSLSPPATREWARRLLAATVFCTIGDRTPACL